MRSAFWMWESGIEHGMCDQIVSRYKSEIGEAGLYSGLIDNGVRKSSVCHVFDKDIQDVIKGFTEGANRSAFGFDISGEIEVQFSHYGLGGKYNYHTDSIIGDDLMVDRKITVVAMLSDESEFRGGELELLGDTINLKKGDVIAFPSFMSHCVRPVSCGERFTLVGWHHGLHFR